MKLPCFFNWSTLFFNAPWPCTTLYHCFWNTLYNVIFFQKIELPCFCSRVFLLLITNYTFLNYQIIIDLLLNLSVDRLIELNISLSTMCSSIHLPYSNMILPSNYTPSCWRHWWDLNRKDHPYWLWFAQLSLVQFGISCNRNTNHYRSF